MSDAVESATVLLSDALRAQIALIQQKARFVQDHFDTELSKVR